MPLCLIKVVGAHPKLNPLIQPLADDSDRPYIQWNMLFPTSDCRRSVDPAHVSWSSGRGDPATFPRVTNLRLVSDTYPWMIDVHARDPDIGVTCGEVDDFIHENVMRMSN